MRAHNKLSAMGREMREGDHELITIASSESANKGHGRGGSDTRMTVKTPFSEEFAEVGRLRHIFLPAAAIH